MKNLSLFLLIVFSSWLFLAGCESENTENNPVSNQSDDIVNLNKHHEPDPPELLVTGLQGAMGSTIGPGRDLFVTESAIGVISRINPRNGHKATFASGLPPTLSAVGFGGVTDVAFRSGKAYALVTLVSPDVGGNHADGIYRIDGTNDFTLIADIGAFNMANPPTGFEFFIPTGVLYAIETYRHGFLVTDGHLNRVLYVTQQGEISIFRSFDNIVPTGLALKGNRVYMAEAGPVPHLPEDGKVVSFKKNSQTVTTIASGAPLLVDVEFSRGQKLYALSQGHFTPGNPPGAPADPYTGALVKVKRDGSFKFIMENLDQPTSFEFIRNTAYIVTLTGEVWTIDNI
jgi:hypothetical protein